MATTPRLARLAGAALAMSAFGLVTVGFPAQDASAKDPAYLRAVTVPALDAKGKEGLYLLRACDAASKDACR